jgi:exopolyphosphatase/guanosine-5'-triphosphate,3'-diphosphate pyrophosphatase
MASAAQRQGSPAARPAFPRLSLLPGGAEAGAQEERVAAVADLGSNSWRLVVYAYVPGASWRRVGDVQESVRIAEGLEATGALGAAAIERGLETLEMFERYCCARGIEGAAVDAVATSAIRDAENGTALLTAGRALTGFDIRVLTIEQEARYGHLAAVNTTGLVDGVALDLGGGSLQLVRVEERQERGVHSWPLGAVRTSERLLPGDGPVPRKRLKRARAATASGSRTRTGSPPAARTSSAWAAPRATSPRRRSAATARR